MRPRANSISTTVTWRQFLLTAEGLSTVRGIWLKAKKKAHWYENKGLKTQIKVCSCLFREEIHAAVEGTHQWRQHRYKICFDELRIHDQDTENWNICWTVCGLCMSYKGPKLARLHCHSFRSCIFLLRFDMNLNPYLCSFPRHVMSYSPAITRCLFLPSFLPVSSWQRRFLSDWQVFCIVTLKGPLNSTKSDTLSLPGQTWSTLTQYSSHSLWSRAGGQKKTTKNRGRPLSLTHNECCFFFSLHACDWPDFSPTLLFFYYSKWKTLWSTQLDLPLFALCSF